MKVAIVHDYFNQTGGAERVAIALHRLFPGAPVYTTILDRDVMRRIWPGVDEADIRTSWMQSLPGIRAHYRAYLPLYPVAVETMRLGNCDLVISSSTAWVKGVHTRKGACHVSFVHAPMRWAWDLDRYADREVFGRAARVGLSFVATLLRIWDRHAAQRPDVLVTNSRKTARWIAEVYGRECEVVPPPVETARFTPCDEDGDYYLVLSRLIPYKRIDLAVAAFAGTKRRLLIIGEGPAESALRSAATSNIEFLGSVSDEVAAHHLARCKALLFPGEEDFGIVPLEANASGRPVIAYKAGGALETVVDGESGVFFDQQTPAALLGALDRCERISWSKPTLRDHAERFGEDAFKRRMAEIIRRELKRKQIPTDAVPFAPGY